MGFTCNSRLGNFARTSISFVCYDRGIFEYFARQYTCVFRRTFRQERVVRGHYYVSMASACNLYCLTPLFFASYFSLGSFIALEGQSLKYSVNMLPTCVAMTGKRFND